MHIRDATVADLADVATVCADALRDDDLTIFLCPYLQDYPSDYRASTLRRVKTRFYSGRKLLVAVTDREDADWNGKSEIVGYAGLETHHDVQRDMLGHGITWNAIELKFLEIERFFIWHLHLDKSISRPNLEAFNAATADGAIFPEFSEYLGLSILTVAPSHQRRGIGGALVRRCQELASEDELPLILTASPAGAGLYLKNGFQKLGLFSFGGDILAEKMVWNPTTAKGNNPEA